MCKRLFLIFICFNFFSCALNDKVILHIEPFPNVELCDKPYIISITSIDGNIDNAYFHYKLGSQVEIFKDSIAVRYQCLPLYSKEKCLYSVLTGSDLEEIFHFKKNRAYEIFCNDNGEIELKDITK